MESACPHCQARYRNLPEEASGRSTRCKRCQSAFIITPASDTAATLTTACPHCQARYRNIPAERLGSPTACKQCGAPFTITRAEEEPPPPDPAQWQAGDILLGTYEVKELLGEGAFGKVHRVFHRRWEVDLAVKSPKPALLKAAGGAENFEREAETWVGLGLHPHVVSCHYVRRIDGLPRVFAEFVPGGDLAHWIAEGKLYAGGHGESLRRMLDVGIQFAWGLDYAHGHQLVHQDVKPANVLLSPAGTVKVTDFGLARTNLHDRKGPQAPADDDPMALPGSGEETMMVRGVGMTRAYCSPEQAAGQSLSRRTDLWSWGLSLLHMFIGERTWPSGTVAAEILATYSPGSRPEIPPMPAALAAFLAECFREDPADRPHDLGVAADRLIDIYQEVTKAPYPRKKPKSGVESADDLNNRAVSLTDLERQSEALTLWDKALSVQAHHLQSTFNKGLIQWRNGELDDERLVRRVEEAVISGDWTALLMLAGLHLERDDPKAAQALLARLDESMLQREEVRLLAEECARRLPASRRLLKGFHAHDWAIHAVKITPDGEQVLSASEDRTIKLWDWRRAKETRAYAGHSLATLAVDLTPDGRFLLSGGADRAVRLWEVASGRRLWDLQEHVDAVTSVAIGADGRVALSSSFATLKLWNLQSGQCAHTLPSHDDQVNAVALSDDGRLCLSAANDRLIKVWEVATGRLVTTLRGHGEGVLAAAFGPGGRLVVSAGADKQLRLWEVESGQCRKVMEGHPDPVNCLALTRDGRHALSGSASPALGLSHLRLWDVQAGRCLRTFDNHPGVITSVDVDAKGETAATANREGALHLFQIASNHRRQAPLALTRIETSEALLQARGAFEQDLGQVKALLSKGRHAAARERLAEARTRPGFARHPEAVALWLSLYRHLPLGKLQGMWEHSSREGHAGTARCLVFTPDGERVFSGGDDGRILLWDASRGELKRAFQGHAGGVTALCCHPEREVIYSGGRDGRLKGWSLDGESPLFDVDGHAGGVRSIAAGSGGSFLLTGGEDERVKLWELDSGRFLREMKGHWEAVSAVSFSLDGLQALSGAHDRTILLWDVVTGQPLGHALECHPEGVTAALISPDGKQAITAGGEEVIKVWELASRNRLLSLKGHSQPVAALSLSADGRYLLSGGEDKRLKLWDLAGGSCLRTLEGHRGEIQAVALSADRSKAVSADALGRIHFWLLDWQLQVPSDSRWDGAVLPFLNAFLIQCQRPQATLPKGGELSDALLTRALTRVGAPSWNADGFTRLMETLSRAGFAWVDPARVQRELTRLAKQIKKGQRDSALLQATFHNRHRLGRMFLALFGGLLVVGLLLGGGLWQSGHDLWRELQWQDSRGVNAALYEAVRRGDADEVAALLDQGADVNGINPQNGWAPIHEAAVRGEEEALGVLLAAGAQVDMRIKQRRGRFHLATPLHLAAMKGHTRICEQLLAAGADANARMSIKQWTPFFLALRWNHEETARLLASHGGRY